MPITIELVAMLLSTYALGLALGWLAWGRGSSQSEGSDS